MSARPNALDQDLDIQGSLSPDNTKTLAEEASAIGSIETTGTGDTIGGTAPTMTLTDAGGAFTAEMVGSYVTIVGATTGANDGEFLILAVGGATVLTYENSAGVAEAFGGTYDVNAPYSLQDDLNFTRTDRRLIKGTASHITAIPTYQRPDAVGTNVDANLTNIAGKTTDAKALVNNRKFENQAVAVANTLVTITDTGNLPHADAVDRTGVPINDGADAGNDLATYAEIINPTTGTALLVLGFARGSIDTDSGGTAVLPADADVVIIDDGPGPAVTFEFDTNGSVVDTATLKGVDISAAANSGDVRDALITAINDARLLGDIAIFASIGGANIVSLKNDVAGVAGNVTITETVAAAGFVVTGMAGGLATAGSRIYGRTQAGSSTEPNSVEVAFRSVPLGDPLSSSVAYTWEADQPTTIDIFYGFRERLDTMTETALRTVLVNGIVGDADLATDIAEIRAAIGIVDGDTDLGGLLTNTSSFFIFSTLDVDPTVVEALNALNAEIDDRTYTGGVLTSGQTITESLQALSNAISGSSVVRTIERILADINSGTAHTIPGAQTYTLDGSNNGQNMWIFWRGILRDPGPVVGGNDYSETSTTSFTPYTKIKAGDHINYMIYS